MAVSGWSIFTSMSGGKRNIPLAAARSCSVVAKRRISEVSAVEASTTSTGKPPPPGSAGGKMANVCTPGMALSLACTSGRMALVGRGRSSQGFMPRPQKPPVGSVTWKVNLPSGVVSRASLMRLVECITWSRVALAGVFTTPKMTPWSSVGASSLGAWVNMNRASALTTAQAR